MYTCKRSADICIHTHIHADSERSLNEHKDVCIHTHADVCLHTHACRFGTLIMSSLNEHKAQDEASLDARYVCM